MTQYKDTTPLFTEFLDVCCTAIQSHGDEFPHKQLLAGAEKILGGRNIGVEVYGDDANSPFDFFTIRLADGTFKLVGHGKQDSKITWKVKESYLKNVVKNRHHYINHPEKLDWDWIKSRLGVEG